MLNNLSHTASPVLIGVPGYTMAAITPDQGAQWLIAVATAIAQLVNIFKPIFKRKNKQKNESSQS